MRKTIGRIMLFLIACSLVTLPIVTRTSTTGTPPIPGVQPVHYYRYMIPIPGDIFNSINILIGGPPGYYLYLDKDYNGSPSSDEKLGQASLKGDLSLTRESGSEA